MTRLLCPLFLVGCTSMEPAPETFAPVVLPAADCPPGPPERGAAAAPDEPAEFSISSEQMASNAEQWKDKSGDPLVAAAPPTPTPPSAPIAAAPAAAPAAPPLATPPPAPVARPLSAGWPLRLVSTLTTTQPPRAILGLPDGEEIVVTAGEMVPKHNVVVMAVGQDRVQLAQVSPSGDHAQVSELVLVAQYSSP